MPRAVPSAHIGPATMVAAKVYAGFKYPGQAMEIPNISSVQQHPTRSLVNIFVLGENFWLSAQFIRRYLAFAITEITNASQNVEPAAIREYMAYSPADALVKRLEKKPITGVSPPFFAIIPREKETAKYPSPMGKPSLNPFKKTFLSFIDYL